jgi:hypothetical protein
MPLDGVARRYADELYAREEEQIREQQQSKMVEVRSKHAVFYPAKSGAEISELVGIAVGWTSKLAQAKADSLVKAYEKSGIAFDDATLREITDEVEQFRKIKQQHAIQLVAREVQRVFESDAPPSLRQSAAAQVENGVGVAVANINRDLRIRRYEVALGENLRQRIYASAAGKKWDVFISHASEDKSDFVDPLANALEKSGLSVWYDKTTLTVGDGLRRSIDAGLANSRFGVVVLSHKFFAKHWTQQELDGLFARQVQGAKVILPVLHRMTHDELRAHSLMLADLKAANSDSGVQQVVKELRLAMGLDQPNA